MSQERRKDPSGRTVESRYLSYTHPSRPSLSSTSLTTPTPSSSSSSSSSSSLTSTLTTPLSSTSQGVSSQSYSLKRSGSPSIFTPSTTPTKRSRFSLVPSPSFVIDSHDHLLTRYLQWHYLLAHTKRGQAQETMLAEQQCKQIMHFIQHQKRRRKDGALALHWESKEHALETLKEAQVQVEKLASQFLRFREIQLKFIRAWKQSLEQLEYKDSMFSNFDIFCTSLESLMNSIYLILEQVNKEKVDDIRQKVVLLATNKQTLKELTHREKQMNNELSFLRGLTRGMEWLANRYEPQWYTTASEILEASTRAPTNNNHEQELERR